MHRAGEMRSELEDLLLLEDARIGEPGSKKRESGVNLPESRAAAPVTVLKVEPGE